MVQHSGTGLFGFSWKLPVETTVVVIWVMLPEMNPMMMTMMK